MKNNKDFTHTPDKLWVKMDILIIFSVILFFTKVSIKEALKLMRISDVWSCPVILNFPVSMTSSVNK